MMVCTLKEGTNMVAMLATAKPGDFVRFAEEKRRYEIQAVGNRYIVCTKPFSAKKTVIYTVVDTKELVRGTENLIFGRGAETREQCEEMLERLEGVGINNGQWNSEVSHRNRIPLVIVSVLK